MAGNHCQDWDIFFRCSCMAEICSGSGSALITRKGLSCSEFLLWSRLHLSSHPKSSRSALVQFNTDNMGLGHSQRHSGIHYRGAVPVPPQPSSGHILEAEDPWSCCWCNVREYCAFSPVFSWEKAQFPRFSQIPESSLFWGGSQRNLSPMAGPKGDSECSGAPGRCVYPRPAMQSFPLTALRGFLTRRFLHRCPSP